MSGIEKKLNHANIRIIDLENHIETIARNHFETGLVKGRIHGLYKRLC
jgi:hypothetical protein